MNERPSRKALTERPSTATRAPSQEAQRRAVTVSLQGTQRTSIADAMAALPDPATLGEGTLVVIPASAEPRATFGSALRSLFRSGPSEATIALRCSALVGRGYVDVGASDNGALAWGAAPRSNA